MSNDNKDYFTEMVKLILGLGVVALIVVFGLRAIVGGPGGGPEQDPAAINERLKATEVVAVVGQAAPKAPAPKAAAQPAKAEAPMSEPSKVEKPEPAAKSEVAQQTAPAAESSGGDDGMGKMIYSKTCFACHSTGLLNSPKKGDAAEWKKRLEAVGGIEGLVKSSITGKGGMPPKGGAANLTDEDMKAAIEYMMK